MFDPLRPLVLLTLALMLGTSMTSSALDVLKWGAAADHTIAHMVDEIAASSARYARPERAMDAVVVVIVLLRTYLPAFRGLRWRLAPLGVALSIGSWLMLLPWGAWGAPSVVGRDLCAELALLCLMALKSFPSAAATHVAVVGPLGAVALSPPTCAPHLDGVLSFVMLTVMRVPSLRARVGGGAPGRPSTPVELYAFAQVVGTRLLLAARFDPPPRTPSPFGRRLAAEVLRASCALAYCALLLTNAAAAWALFI